MQLLRYRLPESVIQQVSAAVRQDTGIGLGSGLGQHAGTFTYQTLVPDDLKDLLLHHVIASGGTLLEATDGNKRVEENIAYLTGSYAEGLSLEKLRTLLGQIDDLNLDRSPVDTVENHANRLTEEGTLIFDETTEVYRLNQNHPAWKTSEVMRHHNELLHKLRTNREKILQYTKNWECDCIYRFYHQSIKVYFLQTPTREMVEFIRMMDPRPGAKALNPVFELIISEGLQKYDDSTNTNWLKHTRPILEAYFHAKMVLMHMAKTLEEVPEITNSLPSAWAHVLYIYNLR